MNRESILVCMLSICVFVSPAMASIAVWLDPSDVIVPGVGETIDVDLWANFSEPVVAWGLDVEPSDPTIMGLTDVVTAPSWDPTTTYDGDGLAGMRFPTGVSGDVLLATLTFTGSDIGGCDLTFGYNDEDEGFLLEFGGLDTGVTYTPSTISVLPEPGTLSLLVLGSVALLRRQR